MNVRAERFPLFDSLRALAALMILGLHAGELGGVAAPNAPLQAGIARLDIGVPIFFVISGFLLYRPFAQANSDGRPLPAVGAYAWRRFLRIVPAYWVALTVIALVFSIHAVFTPHGILTYYGFLQLYSRSTVSGGITQAWTLCVEVTFYIAVPFLALAARRLPGGRGAEAAFIAALTLASVAFNAVVAYGGLAGPITYAPLPLLSALPASFFYFGAGILMALASVALAGRPTAPRIVGLVDRWPSAAWLLAAAALGAMTLIGARGGVFSIMSPTRWMERQLLYALCAAAFVAPAVFGDQRRGATRRILANPALLYIGLISYGIYLWHFDILLRLNAWGWGRHIIVDPYLHWAVSGLVVTVAVATVSWFLIERPALSLKRLVSSPPPVAPVPEVAQRAPTA